jgi:PleD family two-component response regulator
VQAEKNLEPALKRADIALYQAKEGGRNQLVKFV